MFQQGKRKTTVKVCWTSLMHSKKTKVFLSTLCAFSIPG